MAQKMGQLKDWIGRKESETDVATAWPVKALTATLDRTDPDPSDGDEIPLGWNWLYFLEAMPASELGHDGHTKRGGFLPPVELPRRMWAGGRIDFTRPIRVGERLRRDSEILSVDAKEGKSGSLVFVTVRHTVHASNDIVVVEEHDIAYREAAKPGERPPQGKPAPAEAPWRRELIGDPVMLFRYSALTFNAHRIHFDADYCREEGYAGILVHGPLQTLLLLDLCRRNTQRPVKRLEYRATYPIVHTERMSVNGAPAADGAKVDLWTANGAGYYGMVATATLG